MDDVKNNLGLISPFLHVYVAEETTIINYVRNITESTKLSACLLDSLKCQTRPLFFNEIANSLKFPDYFGHNWDALDECLSDLEWLASKGWVLVFLNADKLLNKEKGGDFHALVKLLDNIGTEWSQSRCLDGIHTIEAKPFHSIFHATPQNEKILFQRFGTLLSADKIQIV